jgi:hypothetical protein
MSKARQHSIPPFDVEATLDRAGVSTSIMQLYDPLGMRLNFGANFSPAVLETALL